MASALMEIKIKKTGEPGYLLGFTVSNDIEYGNDFYALVATADGNLQVYPTHELSWDAENAGWEKISE